MERAPRPSFNPAGAGGLLLAAAVACMAAGALVGWIAGSWGIGMLVGAVVGIPVGVVAVYRRYRGAFS
jgi:hypothetical protein